MSTPAPTTIAPTPAPTTIAPTPTPTPTSHPRRRHYQDKNAELMVLVLFIFVVGIIGMILASDMSTEEGSA